MNKKYQRYIEFIVSDIEAPYFINMKQMYGLRPDEYSLVLSKLFNQPVSIKGHYVYEDYVNNADGNLIYYENSDGYWVKREYNAQGNQIYYENSNGYWSKSEYDANGNVMYYENSDGEIEDNRYE